MRRVLPLIALRLRCRRTRIAIVALNRAVLAACLQLLAFRLQVCAVGLQLLAAGFHGAISHGASVVHHVAAAHLSVGWDALRGRRRVLPAT